MLSIKHVCRFVPTPDGVTIGADKGQVVKGSMFKGGVGSTRSSAAKKSSAGETFASREFDVKLS